MNHKTILTERLKHSKAKKDLKHIKNIIKFIDDALNSNNEKRLNMAYSFIHIMDYHINHGDLKADNIHLSTLLRIKEIENNG